MTSNPANPQKKIAQLVGYCDSWWPGAERTKNETNVGFSDLCSRLPKRPLKGRMITKYQHTLPQIKNQSPKNSPFPNTFGWVCHTVCSKVKFVIL